MFAKSVLLSRAQLHSKDSLDRLRIKGGIRFNLLVLIVQDVCSKSKRALYYETNPAVAGRALMSSQQ